VLNSVADQTVKDMHAGRSPREQIMGEVRSYEAGSAKNQNGASFLIMTILIMTITIFVITIFHRFDPFI
jgi:hypothetical protein